MAKWRRRFVAQRLEGLSDEYRRGGAPRTISDEQVEQVIVKTLEEAPTDGSTHWSTRSMAAAVGLSQRSIVRIWHAFGLKPHRYETFKISTDPNFIDKVHDVVGLYLNPPERALVLCIDEKTGIQALDRTRNTDVVVAVDDEALLRLANEPAGRAELERRGLPPATLDRLSELGISGGRT